VRLTPDVLLVGGGTLTGFGLSSDFDAHVYALDGGDEVALVDCGMGTPQGMARVLENLAADGIDPRRVRRLLLTHYHADHASGASRYRARLDLAVSIGAGARAALEGPDHAATSFAAAQAAGIFDAAFEYPGCQVDLPLADGDELAIGRLTVRFLATPGHCRGHGSYLVSGGERTCLLAGDALFHSGRLFLQAIPDCDLGASLDTVQRLAALEFDALLPGHGALALRDGPAHAALAKGAVDRLAVPPGIV
jgi:glyoxylase-like metal-dependent hydrolase (beta-lactamase superfamily II)